MFLFLSHFLFFYCRKNFFLTAKKKKSQAKKNSCGTKKNLEVKKCHYKKKAFF